MKKALINYMKHGISDDIPTPPEAVEPLLKYLPKPPLTIWEPSARDTNTGIAKVLVEVGYDVVATHIEHGKNYFTYQPQHFDMIITNPPYSIKTEWLKRTYSFNKPFCLLLPITALEGKERNELYRQHGIELLIFDKRVQFLDRKNVWFAVAWFCYKVLPQPLIFEKLS